MPVTQSWTLQDKDFFFDPVWHTYKLNGCIIPSVTKIIRTVTAQDLSHIPPDVLKRAADRGTAIHKEIETGVISSIEANWIEKQINRNNCVFEKMFYCEYDNFTFAGTADIIGIDTVYDIKTQNEPDVFMWMLQLNLYNLFFKKEHLKVLHTPKSGNYKVFDIPHLTENQIKQIIFAYQNNQTIGDDFMKDLKVIEDVKEVEPIKLELEIYKQNIGELTTNAEKLKEQVEKQLQFYKAENYSPDTIDNAKKDKAELNKAAKMLNDKRIEIERQFMKPIDDFKNTINETVALIKTASGEIDLIVKAVENKEKEAKKAKAETEQKDVEVIGEMSEPVPEVKEDTTSEPIAATASERIYTVDFTAMGTEAQLKELQSFMDKIDIKYQFKK